jgi:hypothetical protein
LWDALTAPFSARLLGHQQATDGYLPGLAVKEGGVLVTFDRAVSVSRAVGSGTGRL